MKHSINEAVTIEVKQSETILVNQERYAANIHVVNG